MKTTLKKIYYNSIDHYLYANRSIAFKKRYRKYDQKLFIPSISKEDIRKYKERWSAYGRKIETKTFTLCYNLSGKLNYDIVPENLFAAIIEKRLNPHKELSFFSVKNMYNKWFDNGHVFPKSYFHRIDNIYYDPDFNIIENIERYIDETKIEFPIVLKPSKDTSGGKNVRILKDKNQIKNFLFQYRNLVCQEFIHQNSFINDIYDQSINSIRSCLYRDVKSGSFQVINHAIRFGKDGSLDNLSSGGIQCYINSNGSLNDYALGIYGEKYFKHPNSGVSFKTINIPNFNLLNDTVIKIANQIPFCNLVSLDMCLDFENNWRCLEINLMSQTIRFPQYAGYGFFGKYTDEVIERTQK